MTRTATHPPQGLVSEPSPTTPQARLNLPWHNVTLGVLGHPHPSSQVSYRNLRAPGLTRPSPRQPERRPCRYGYCRVGTGRTPSKSPGILAPGFLVRGVARVRSCRPTCRPRLLIPPRWSLRRRGSSPCPRPELVLPATTAPATIACRTGKSLFSICFSFATILILRPRVKNDDVRMQ